jgi:predicted RNA-binding Zn-ribbon protein involved in translation (DUF1610 family)
MAGNEHKPVSPMGGVKAFSCPNCGGQVTLRAPGQTLAAACEHCSAVIDLSDENLRILQKASDKMDYKPVIPIGRRGKLEGVEWEIVGFMVRKVVGFPYFWEEYLLFNPWYGFKWLVNNYGHWGFVTPLMDLPDYQPSSKKAQYDDIKYKMFARGGAEVTFVLGEFYWKVKRGDKVQTADLVNPPYMLSYEKDNHGSTWSKGVYIEPKVVQEAFKLDKMPFRRRVGANQPNKASQNWKAVRPVFFLALAILIGLQVFFTNKASNEQVMAEATVLTREQPGWVSKPFTLKGNNGNVEVRFQAPSLGNSWVYLDGYLHNKAENKNYGFTKEWEYYSGRDSDGSWTEGSRSASQILNNIPGGEYEMVLESQLGATLQKVNVSVKRDVPFLANFWLILIAISVMPLYLFITSRVFEKSRWEDADT